MERLRVDFPGWRHWRTQEDGVPSCWVATLRDPAAGVDATVICETAAQQREALINQARQAVRAELTGDERIDAILHGEGKAANASREAV
jgi:hypothetical protein